MSSTRSSKQPLGSTPTPPRAVECRLHPSLWPDSPRLHFTRLLPSVDPAPTGVPPIEHHRALVFTIQNPPASPLRILAIITPGWVRRICLDACSRATAPVDAFRSLTIASSAVLSRSEPRSSHMKYRVRTVCSLSPCLLVSPVIRSLGPFILPLSSNLASPASKLLRLLVS